MNYLVAVVEEGHRIPVGETDDIVEARRIARDRLDDALSRNKVHVYESVGLVDLGYAYIGGDGGSYWHNAEKS